MIQQAIQHAKTYFVALRDLIYPRNCPGCGSALLRGESELCITCELDLPFNPYFENPNNEVMQVFSGRLPLETVNTLLYFNKSGIAQRLMHNLKYEDNQALGIYLGACLGKRFISTLKSPIDLIIPVPLHPDKEKIRGYNQCTSIAEGIGSILKVPVASDLVIRNKSNVSQTKLNRAKRWDNVAGIFSLTNPNLLRKKHVLLIDDTLTTGATLESCGSTLLEAEGLTLSIATLAYAK